MALLQPRSVFRYRVNSVTVGPSDNTEVTVISQTIPGGMMGTAGILRCRGVGDYLNNNGAAGRTIIMRVYCGGTKVFDSNASTSLSQSANRRMVTWDLMFSNLGASNSNRLGGDFVIGAAAGPTTGLGALVAATLSGNVGSNGAVAIDTSVDWDWKITFQHSASESTLDLRVSSILVEVV